MFNTCSGQNNNPSQQSFVFFVWNGLRLWLLESQIFFIGFNSCCWCSYFLMMLSIIGVNGWLVNLLYNHKNHQKLKGWSAPLSFWLTKGYLSFIPGQDRWKRWTYFKNWIHEEKKERRHRYIMWRWWWPSLNFLFFFERRVSCTPAPSVNNWVGFCFWFFVWKIIFKINFDVYQIMKWFLFNQRIRNS